MSAWTKQDNKATWIDDWKGQGHMIDDFLIPRGWMNVVNSVKVIHEEGADRDAIEPWTEYTDHNPVELKVCARWHQYRKKQEIEHSREAGADVSKMKGISLDGESFKRLYAATLDSKLLDMKPEKNMIGDR